MPHEWVILRVNRYGKQYRRLDRQLRSWRTSQQRRARLAAKKELARLVEEDLLGNVEANPSLDEVICPFCDGAGHMTRTRLRDITKEQRW